MHASYAHSYQDMKQSPQFLQGNPQINHLPITEPPVLYPFSMTAFEPSSALVDQLVQLKLHPWRVRRVKGKLVCRGKEIF